MTHDERGFEHERALGSGHGEDHLSPEERITAARLMEVFQRVLLVHPYMSIHQLSAFLLVALYEGRNQKWYAERAGTPQTTMSRILLDIGDMTRAREPGLGLVTGRPSPRSLRDKEYRLTPKGRTLLKVILNIIQRGKAR